MEDLPRHALSNRMAFFTALIVFFGCCSGLAQELTQPDPPDQDRLRVAFPANGDTLNFSRVRYAGAVGPGAEVRVQGKKTRVYPSGAFVGLVDLSDGFNSIIFGVRDSLGVLSDTLVVYRPPIPKPLPEIPTEVAAERVFPADDVYLSPGDRLEVEFWGSPGGQASFSLDKIAKNVRLFEMPGSNRTDRGHYKGYVTIPDVETYKPKQVIFKFRGKDNRRIKFYSMGKLHILSPMISLIGTTVDSINLIRTEPDGEIWMELQKGIQLETIAEQGGFKKVRLADDAVGFIVSNSLRPLPLGFQLPYASIGSIATTEDDDWIKLRINISDRVPFYIEQILQPAALEITFYRARLAPQWIMYPQSDETIRTIRWRQHSGEKFILRIELNQTQQWGFWGRYVGKQFRLNIRKTPRISPQPDSLFRDLTITIDPGHGGEFEGAVSATGMFEKDVNLKYAMMVADSLKALGARVVLTRTEDTTLTLASRIALARDANSHIFVSLHNNSIGAATNPLRPRGTSTYYTVPQSQEIAKTVYHRMLALGLEPFGRISSTYYVTRQTDMISFIVEAAFMTHPEDEMLLLDSEFLPRLAGSVVAGIKDFVLKQQKGVSMTTEVEVGDPPQTKQELF